MPAGLLCTPAALAVGHAPWPGVVGRCQRQVASHAYQHWDGLPSLGLKAGVAVTSMQTSAGTGLPPRVPCVGASCHTQGILQKASGIPGNGALLSPVRAIQGTGPRYDMPATFLPQQRHHPIQSDAAQLVGTPKWLLAAHHLMVENGQNMVHGFDSLERPMHSDLVHGTQPRAHAAAGHGLRHASSFDTASRMANRRSQAGFSRRPVGDIGAWSSSEYSSSNAWVSSNAEGDLMRGRALQSRSNQGAPSMISEDPTRGCLGGGMSGMGNQSLSPMQHGMLATLNIADHVQHNQVGMSACNSLLIEQNPPSAPYSQASPAMPFNGRNAESIAVQDVVTPALAHHLQVQGNRMIGDIGAFPAGELWEDRSASYPIHTPAAGSTAFSASGGDGLEQGQQAIVLTANLQVPVLGALPGVAEACLLPHARASTDQREVQVEVVPQQLPALGSAALSDVRLNLDGSRFLMAPDSGGAQAIPYQNPFRAQIRDD